jgi:hypothetical protein
VKAIWIHVGTTWSAAIMDIQDCPRQSFMKAILFVQTIALQLTGRLDALTIGPIVFVKLVKTFPIA